eukprot:s1431_g9.t1
MHGGQALGHAAQLEANKREKVPSMLSASQMPKSVQEAEELIRSTFGEMAQQSKIKEIAANLFQHAAKPPSEDSRVKSVVRSQELEFIRMSRQEVEPPNLVRTMYRLFQEELISSTKRKQIDGATQSASQISQLPERLGKSESFRGAASSGLTPRKLAPRLAVEHDQTVNMWPRPVAEDDPLRCAAGWLCVCRNIFCGQTDEDAADQHGQGWREQLVIGDKRGCL